MHQLENTFLKMKTQNVTLIRKRNHTHTRQNTEENLIFIFHEIIKPIRRLSIIVKREHSLMKKAKWLLFFWPRWEPVHGVLLLPSFLLSFPALIVIRDTVANWGVLVYRRLTQTAALCRVRGIPLFSSGDTNSDRAWIGSRFFFFCAGL